ncbi:MAG: BON domain-containing protein [Thermoanaerobaculia bacterium]
MALDVHSSPVEVLPVSIFDDQIRRQAARSLFGNTAFVEYRAHGNPPIHILVENGRVTLYGRLASAVEARRAQDLVRFGSDAKSVDNRIDVVQGGEVSRPFARATS